MVRCLTAFSDGLPRFGPFRRKHNRINKKQKYMDINLYEWLIEPFAEFDFMRYALASVVFLALSAAPVGVFLVMRRMSLVGDALGHAVLPGAAVGYMIGGLSLPAMSAAVLSPAW